MPHTVCVNKKVRKGKLKQTYLASSHTFEQGNTLCEHHWSRVILHGQLGYDQQTALGNCKDEDGIDGDKGGTGDV